VPSQALRKARPVIVLFTDFGREGPYTPQLRVIFEREAPGVPIVELLSDAPTFDPQLSAYLLAAYVQPFPPGSVIVAVVDPGVGGSRQPCVVHVDRRWYVGPDNGLFEVLLRRAMEPPRAWSIDWRPERLSASFHGRDLFAPVAARLRRGTASLGRALDAEILRRREWPDDLPRVVYIDRYGNALTGVRAAGVPHAAVILAGGHPVAHAFTFCDVPDRAAFWYENANGLIELAVNRGRAADVLQLHTGSCISVEL
jgi:S-adenosylmethionine hydrolase